MEIAIFLVTLAGMEGFAWAMHRWVMHGPGWFLHRSHHRARSGYWEWNDLYFAIFALPSVALMLGGVRLGWGDWATAAGAGIAAYGAIYLLFHDLLVHRRFPHRFVPRHPYLKRIVQAHHIHHATQTKRDAVSFGFLLAPPPQVLKSRLARNGSTRLRPPHV